MSTSFLDSLKISSNPSKSSISLLSNPFLLPENDMNTNKLQQIFDITNPIFPNSDVLTKSSSSIINCKETNSPNNCIWYSPSISDRSNPKNNMVCPSDKSDLCWMDTSANEKRQFKCGECNVNTNGQTDLCHISMTASRYKDTSNWSTNMTTGYNSSCKNKWFKA